eukprot:g3459.t1
MAPPDAPQDSSAADCSWPSFLEHVQTIDEPREYRDGARPFEADAAAFVFEGIALRLLRDNDTAPDAGSFVIPADSPKLLQQGSRFLNSSRGNKKRQDHVQIPGVGAASDGELHSGVHNKESASKAESNLAAAEPLQPLECPRSVAEVLLPNLQSEKDEVQLAARLIDVVAPGQLDPDVMRSRRRHSGDSDDEHLNGDPAKLLDFDNMPPASPKREFSLVPRDNGEIRGGTGGNDSSLQDDSVLGPAARRRTNRGTAGVTFPSQPKPPPPKFVDWFSTTREATDLELPLGDGEMLSVRDEAAASPFVRMQVGASGGMRGMRRLFDPARMRVPTSGAGGQKQYEEDHEKYLIGYENGLPSVEEFAAAIADDVFAFFFYVLQKYGARPNFYLLEKLVANCCSCASTTGGATSAGAATNVFMTNFLTSQLSPHQQETVLPSCLERLLDVAFQFAATTPPAEVLPGAHHHLQFASRSVERHLTEFVGVLFNAPLIKFRPGLFERLLCGLVDPGTADAARSMLKAIASITALQYLAHEVVAKELFTVTKVEGNDVCLYSILAFECLKTSVAIAEVLVPALHKLLLGATVETDDERALIVDMLGTVMFFYGDEALALAAGGAAPGGSASVEGNRFKTVFLALAKAWIAWLDDKNLRSRALGFLPKFACRQFYQQFRGENLANIYMTGTIGSSGAPTGLYPHHHETGVLVGTSAAASSSSMIAQMMATRSAQPVKSLEKTLWHKILALMMDTEEAPRVQVVEKITEITEAGSANSTPAKVEANAKGNNSKAEVNVEQEEVAEVEDGASSDELRLDGPVDSVVPAFVLKRLANRLLDKRKPVRKAALGCAKMLLLEDGLLGDQSARDALVDQLLQLYDHMHRNGNPAEATDVELVVFGVEKKVSQPGGGREPIEGRGGGKRRKRAMNTLVSSLVRLSEYEALSIYAKQKRHFTAETKTILDNIERDNWEVKEHRTYAKFRYREIWRVCTALFEGGGAHICDVVTTCRDCLVGRQDWWLVSKSAFFQADLRALIDKQASGAAKPQKLLAAGGGGDEKKFDDEDVEMRDAFGEEADEGGDENGMEAAVGGGGDEAARPRKIAWQTRKKYERRLAAYCDVIERACSSHRFGDWFGDGDGQSATSEADSEDEKMEEEDVEKQGGAAKSRKRPRRGRGVGEAVLSAMSDDEGGDEGGASGTSRARKVRRKMQTGKKNNKLELAEDIDMGGGDGPEDELPEEGRSKKRTTGGTERLLDDADEDGAGRGTSSNSADHRGRGSKAGATTSAEAAGNKKGRRKNQWLSDLIAYLGPGGQAACKSVELVSCATGAANGSDQNPNSSAAASAVPETKVIHFLEVLAQVAPQTMAGCCTELLLTDADLMEETAKRRDAAKAAAEKQDRKSGTRSVWRDQLVSGKNQEKYMRILGRVGAFCIRTGYRNFQELSHAQIQAALPVLKTRPDLVCKFLKFVRGTASTELFEGVLRSILGYVRKQGSGTGSGAAAPTSSGNADRNTSHGQQEGSNRGPTSSSSSSSTAIVASGVGGGQQQNLSKRQLEIGERAASHRIVMATKLIKFFRTQQRPRALYMLEENAAPAHYNHAGAGAASSASAAPFGFGGETTGQRGGTSTGGLLPGCGRMSAQNVDLLRSSTGSLLNVAFANRGSSLMAVAAPAAFGAQHHSLAGPQQYPDPFRNTMASQSLAGADPNAVNPREQQPAKDHDVAINWKRYRDVWNEVVADIAAREEQRQLTAAGLAQQGVGGAVGIVGGAGVVGGAGPASSSAALVATSSAPPPPAISLQKSRESSILQLSLFAQLGDVPRLALAIETELKAEKLLYARGGYVGERKITAFRCGLQALMCANQASASSSSTSVLQAQPAGVLKFPIEAGGGGGASSSSNTADSADPRANKQTLVNLNKRKDPVTQQDLIIVEDFARASHWTGDEAKLFKNLEKLVRNEVGSDHKRHRDLAATMNARGVGASAAATSTSSGAAAQNATADLQPIRDAAAYSANKEHLLGAGGAEDAQNQTAAKASGTAASSSSNALVAAPPATSVSGAAAGQHKTVLVSATMEHKAGGSGSSKGTKSKRTQMYDKVVEGQLLVAMRVLQLVRLPESKSTLLSRIAIGAFRGYARIVHIGNFAETEKIVQCLQTFFGRFHWSPKQFLQIADYVSEKEKTPELEWILSVVQAVCREQA